MVRWIGLSRRGPKAQLDGLYEGVPDHLRQGIEDWIDYAFSRSKSNIMKPATQFERQVQARLRLLMPWPIRNGLTETDLLDIVDAILKWHPEREQHGPYWFSLAGQLGELLEAGGSAWRVNARYDGLERRVDETVAASVEDAVNGRRKLALALFP